MEYIDRMASFQPSLEHATFFFSSFNSKYGARDMENQNPPTSQTLYTQKDPFSFWSLSWNLALPKSQTFGQFWRCERWCEEKTTFLKNRRFDWKLFTANFYKNHWGWGVKAQSI